VCVCERAGVTTWTALGLVISVMSELVEPYGKTPQHRQKWNEKGELLLNTIVFFHIATKVLSSA
jgi:hypothetical protein